MKKIFYLIVFLTVLLSGVKAQVENYSLKLSANGRVDAGRVSEINGLSAYTIQLWFNPEIWTPQASIFTRGSGDNLFELKLGNVTGELEYCIGSQSTKFSSTNINAGKWAHLSIIYDQATIKIMVNNSIVFTNNSSQSIPSSEDNLYLGKNFTGRIDEFRIWNASLSNDYVLWRNTLNKYHPQWNNLLLYYKFDQNLCSNVVDYTFRHHGIFSDAGAAREKVSDNTLFKYRKQSAYTDFSRFADRGVDKEKYLLANDIIMLGVESNADGTITMPFSDNQGKLMNASQLSSFAGRNGVLAFSGAGSGMDVGTKTLTPTAKYSFHTWIYIDEWTEGAYLFRKESSDQNGFSVRFGNPDTKQLIVRLNGQEFKRNIPTTVITQAIGAWWHLGVVAFAPDLGVNKSFMFTFNGKGYFPLTSDVPATKPATLIPQNNQNVNAFIGLDFKGKLDETVVWHTDLSELQMQNYMNSLPMPGFGKIVDAAEVMYKMNAYWNYNLPENPGYDSYSYKHFMGIVRSAFDGYRGYTIRMSVKSHAGWETTFSDAAKRKTLAAGIVEAAKEFDGIDLDFEWCYDGTCFNNYGLLIEEIGKIMPADKVFTVSPHYVSYAFPTKYMQYVDYFNFQIYGPSANVFRWSTYQNAYNLFKNHGYPKDKIIMSFATTTSKAYDDAAGTVQSTAAPIGVRNGLLDGNYTPDMDVVMDNNGKYRFITGVNQTFNRSEWVQDNDLAGIMYWDMGNDVPTSHRYSLPKTSNYSIASNVDSLITEVVMTSPNGLKNIVSRPSEVKIYPNPANEIIRIILNNNELIEHVKVYSLSGQLIKTVSENKNICSLDINNYPTGIYNVLVSDANGQIYHNNFVKF